MSQLPVFLSVVLVMRDQSNQLEARLAHAVSVLEGVVRDYELIVVDNASGDDSISVLKRLTGEQGLPNIQVFALTREVDSDTASWVGLEHSLGDYTAVVDPVSDDIDFLPDMLAQAMAGADVVFANNTQKPKQAVLYGTARALFNGLYRHFNGIDLAKDAPQYRLLSREVVNFILRHPQPALAYRHLPVTAGFPSAHLAYSAAPGELPERNLWDGVDRGMRMLVSTTRAPLRLVTSLALFGAVANVIYSLYVVLIWLLKSDVAEGWASLSLQQSGMFFLISLVLLVLGEYLLQLASLSNEGPSYHVGQEFNSSRQTRREKLNVEVPGEHAPAAESEVPPV